MSSSPSPPPPTSPIDWPRFTELIRSNRRFVLTTHVRPDCDAVGSQLGMAYLLERLGKEIRIVNPFELPPNLQFIDPEGKLQSCRAEGAAQWIESADALIVLDTTAWAQLGEMGEFLRATGAKKMVLDHHPSGDDLGAELFKDPRAEATGRLVVQAAGQLGVELAPHVAAALFAAVATDTGWFRFSSTTAETYRLAAQLVDAGAKPDQIYRSLYENDTLARMQLIGRAMVRARTERGGRLIYTWLTRDDFESTGAIPQDSEDVINETLSVGGTRVAVILVEQQDGAVKISFRSRCDVDCRRVAEQFGGGGHKNAAGAVVGGPLDAVRAKVLDATRAAMG